ncbi:MAG: hypothetical protein WEB52_11755 [Dehalococcoidia bacterium]
MATVDNNSAEQQIEITDRFLSIAPVLSTGAFSPAELEMLSERLHMERARDFVLSIRPAKFELAYFQRMIAAASLDSLLSTIWRVHTFTKKRIHWTLNFFDDLIADLPVAPELGSVVWKVFQPGTFLGDWAIVTSVDTNQQEKWEAIQRLTDEWFNRPIHSLRWPLAKSELVRRAGDAGSSVDVELRNAVLQCVLLAANDVASEQAPISGMFRSTRAALSNRLMDDLAGPGWRRRLEGREVALKADQLEDPLDLAYHAEIRALHANFWQSLVGIPRSQREALLARIEGRPLTNAQHQALYRLRGSERWRKLDSEVRVA